MWRLLILMTAASVVIGGGGTFGPLSPGWSVSEDATPIAPGDSSGGVGSVSFALRQGTDSEFAIDEDYTFTHALGDITGKVATVVSNGSAEVLDTDLSMTGTTVLTQLNADRVSGPIWYDNTAPEPFLQYGTDTGQVANSYAVAVDPADGSVYVTSFGGIDVSLLTIERNRVIKFDADGNFLFEFGSPGSGNGQFGPAIPTTSTPGPSGIAVSPVDGSVYVYDGYNNRVQKFNSSGTYQTKWGSAGTGDGQFGSSLTNTIAVDASGNVYVTDRGNYRVQKFTSTGTYSAKVVTNASGDGYIASPYDVKIGPSGNVYVSRVGQMNLALPDVRIYSPSLSFLSSIPYDPATFLHPASAGSSLYGYAFIQPDLDGNLWVAPLFTNFVKKIDSTGAEITRYYLPNSVPSEANDNYSISQGSDGTVFTYMKTRGLAGSNFSDGALRVNAFQYTPITLSQVLQRYVDLINPALTINYTATTDPQVFLPGWSGNVWEHIKQLTSQYGVEVSATNNIITVSDIGTRVFDFNNVKAGGASLSLNTQSTGRRVQFTNYNTQSGGFVMLDTDRSGTTFQADVGTKTVTSVQTGNYPVTLNKPTPSDITPPLPGQYNILSSDNLPVTVAEWTAAGGDVSVAIDPIVPGTIIVTIVGPTSAISGKAAPYSLSRVGGAGAVPAFSITGSGVTTSPEVVNVSAGTDSSKTTQDVAFTVDNIAHASMLEIYHRVPWALMLASGPMLTLSASIPTSQVSGFGLTPGTAVEFKENIYRVTDSSIGREWTSFNATRFYTVGGFDTQASAMTVGGFDAIWANYKCKDFDAKPLRTFA